MSVADLNIIDAERCDRVLSWHFEREVHKHYGSADRVIGHDGRHQAPTRTLPAAQGGGRIDRSDNGRGCHAVTNRDGVDVSRKRTSLAARVHVRGYGLSGEVRCGPRAGAACAAQSCVDRNAAVGGGGIHQEPGARKELPRAGTSWKVINVESDQAAAKAVSARVESATKTPSCPPLQVAVLETKRGIAARYGGAIGAERLIGAAHAFAALADGATTGLFILPRTGAAAKLRDA